MKKVVVLVLVVLLLWGLLACSTTKGTLLEKSAERERKDSKVRIPKKDKETWPDEDYYHDFYKDRDKDYYESEKPVPKEPRQEKPTCPTSRSTGLMITTTPLGVRVYIGNIYLGTTPLVLEGSTRRKLIGRHELTLSIDDYYSKTVWIEYSGATASFHFVLDRISGFLQFADVPPHAEINFGSTWSPVGRRYELAVGSQSFRIRAFGFEEGSIAVDIQEGRTTVLPIDLKETDFTISNLEADKPAFHPRNPGLLGSVRIRFRVSGPGSGGATIVDSRNRIVMSRYFGAFTTREQDFNWDGRDRQGVPVPDGTYTVRIQAEGTRGGQQESAELKLKIDSSMVPRFRSLWSGSAGLLYAPTSEILPRGRIQLSSGILVHASGDVDEPIVRIPVNFAMRAGVDRRNVFELDTSIGVNIGLSTDMLYLPWFISAALKASLFRIPGNVALVNSAQVKLTYRSVHTDTLANSSGLSLGLPTALHWGPLSLLFSPELIMSPYTVSYDPDEILELGLYGWIYGRAGLLLDLHPFSFGASLSLRTLPFDEGFGLDLPFQTALEAHWQFFKSHGRSRFLSLYVAGEFEAVDSYYLLGGVGLGILN
jgi:hypothetical protein